MNQEESARPLTDFGTDTSGYSVRVGVKGVSKEEPVVFNEEGGGQSRTLYDFTLADPKAMFEMCKVLKEGADKYGAENWRLISIDDHLNHLLIHIYAYLAGDRSDEHLSHIMCRALFAQAVDVQSATDIQKVKDMKRGQA